MIAIRVLQGYQLPGRMFYLEWAVHRTILEFEAFTFMIVHCKVHTVVHVYSLLVLYALNIEPK